jgi:two-component system, NtrC family, response regulator AtoC
MARASPVSSVHPTGRLVGNAPALRALRAHIGHLAAFDTVGSAFVPTLLLQGETGTGKGLVARVIHDGGPRAQGPFIDVNCAAIPETLLEVELFGFEAGTFTDAKRAKPGLFESASGGTLFLDEIDALPLPLQAKLLSAFEEKRVRRLGAVASYQLDVKLIAATPTDLSRRVAERRFRPDLYHRLAVVVLEIPPCASAARIFCSWRSTFCASMPKHMGCCRNDWAATPRRGCRGMAGPATCAS